MLKWRMISKNVALLYWQLAWARVILWVATAGRDADTPGAHQYLADVHHKLADEFEVRGRKRIAGWHRQIANEHAAEGTPPTEPRPAAAMAMPVPQPPVFTDARGSQFEPDPDDVA